MNWKGPLEDVVDVMIVLCLLGIVFRPRKDGENRAQAEKAG